VITRYMAEYAPVGDRDYPTSFRIAPYPGYGDGLACIGPSRYQPRHIGFDHQLFARSVGEPDGSGQNIMGEIRGKA
jgi:hypothetical protein